MRIYVLRHGIAEQRRPGKPDESRALTAEGKEKLARVLERARRAKVSPSQILTSPLVRAVESAELAAATLRCQKSPERTDALLPEAEPAALWNAIRARKSAGELLVAGHEPHLSKFVAYLLAAPSLQLDLKKGAMVRLDTDAFGPQPHCVLEWILTPALA